MKIVLSETARLLGESAARRAADRLRAAVAEKGAANLLVSTGASQFTTLEALTALPVDWPRVTMYHLDEYVGVGADHPASFRGYLRARLVDKVPLGGAVLIDGLGDPRETVARLNSLMETVEIDVALIGIGENAHIAFNDPPADFEKRDAYHIVTLDAGCKEQQVREGWFASVSEVPRQAISMTCRRILRSKSILCPVPYRVKARAVRDLLAAAGPDNRVPATLLLEHPDCTLFLDRESASLADLSGRM